MYAFKVQNSYNKIAKSDESWLWKYESTWNILVTVYSLRLVNIKCLKSKDSGPL